MSEKLFLSIYLFFIMVIILGLQIITPNLTRKELVLGVRIPLEEIHCKEIKEIHKKFIKNNLIVGIPFILFFTFLNYKLFSTGMFLFTTFTFIFINFGVYMISNKEVKKIKAEKGWLKSKKQVVTIDTSFSRERNSKMLISSWYFLIPVAIILLNIILGYTYYEVLPSRVPTHWDFAGNITGYQNKSTMLIWEIPLTQIFVTVIFFISYKAIGWSKQQISSSNPEEGKVRNRVFRRVWSVYMVIFSIITNLLITLGTLQIFRVFNISNSYVNFAIIFFLVVSIGGSIVISIKVGQGGSNLKLGDKKGEDLPSSDRDDDMYWKFGNSVYYNSNDPSLFVEKRFGVGWTINAGRPLGMGIYIGIIIFTIVVIVMATLSKN